MIQKVLTVLEPYASALVYGPKNGENRPRKLGHTGELLIHAGLSRRLMPDLSTKFGRKLFYALGETRYCLQDWWLDRTLGHIIGMVVVREPMRGEDCGDNWWAAWDQWFHLITESRVFQQPIPCRGRQSLFNLPLELEAPVREQIAISLTPTEAMDEWRHQRDLQFITPDMVTDHGRLSCD